MAILVIGGQASGVGKTSIACGLISALSHRSWSAIKITQCKHSGPYQATCDCQLQGCSVGISEERNATAATDSSRYLAAGAVRSLWIRTLSGHLEEAMPRIRDEIAGARNVLIESNSVLRYLDPDLYAVALDPRSQDFKPSVKTYLHRADAILIPAGSSQPADWPQSVQIPPAFHFSPPDYCPPEFVAFVASSLHQDAA